MIYINMSEEVQSKTLYIHLSDNVLGIFNKLNKFSVRVFFIKTCISV